MPDNNLVAEYFTQQLPQPRLEQELHNAIRRAREQLAQRHPQQSVEDDKREPDEREL